MSFKQRSDLQWLYPYSTANSRRTCKPLTPSVHQCCVQELHLRWCLVRWGRSTTNRDVFLFLFVFFRLHPLPPSQLAMIHIILHIQIADININTHYNLHTPLPPMNGQIDLNIDLFPQFYAGIHITFTYAGLIVNISYAIGG